MDLKVQRITRRIKQRELADRLGLSRSWVAKVEFERGTLTDETVGRYMAALLTFDNGRTEPDARTAEVA
jgi:transcriptional regulator with XRE-family HTH domain